MSAGSRSRRSDSRSSPRRSCCPRRSSGAAEDPRWRSAAEDLLDQVGGGLFELVVPAVCRRLVRAPPLEGRGVPEPIALKVVVRHLHDPLRAKRLPGQVLSSIPAAGRTRQALARSIGCPPPRPLP